MTKTRKLLSMVFALVMVFSMMAPMASAATSDPNMTSNDIDPSTSSPIFSYTVTQGLTRYVDLYAVPANSGFVGTGFTNQVDALLVDDGGVVEWKVLGGSSGGVSIESVESQQISGGHESYAEVKVLYSAPVGSASVRCTNTLTGGFVDFTIVIDDYSGDPSTTANNIGIEMYDDTSTLLTNGICNVSGLDFISDRPFITAMDSVERMKTNGIIVDYGTLYGPTFINSFTLTGGTITPSYPEGWQYRIYRGPRAANQVPTRTLTLVEASTVMDLDDIRIMAGDYIIWKVGAYDDDTLFDSVIYRP